jgi:hypothetical protein
VPIVRYTCLVGSLLLGLLFLLADRDPPAVPAAPDRWTSVDSLRAMAHLGEPGQDARLVPIESAPRDLANRSDPAETAVPEKPLIMNAQANMDRRKTAGRPAAAAAKPRRQKLASRQVRVRTAIAENASSMRMEVFRPPSW